MNSLNNLDFENYVVNKKPIPCDGCPMQQMCEEKFTECSAMRNWCAKGDYKLEDIQKHIRKAA